MTAPTRNRTRVLFADTVGCLQCVLFFATHSIDRESKP